MISTFALAAAFACLQTDEKAVGPVFKFELSRAKDSMVAVREKDRTVLVVTSESGIGGATINLAKGEWPERLTLRFLYLKDGGFRNLEDLRLRTGHILVEGGIKSSGRMRFCFLDGKGKPDTVQPGAADPAGFMYVVVEKINGAMEVTLPPRMLRGNEEWTVTWIDAYRR